MGRGQPGGRPGKPVQGPPPLLVPGGQMRHLSSCPAQASPAHRPCSLPQPEGSPWGYSSVQGWGSRGALAPGPSPRRGACSPSHVHPGDSGRKPGQQALRRGQKASVPRPLPADLMREGQCCLSFWREAVPGGLLTPQQACWSRIRPAWPWALTSPGRDGPGVIPQLGTGRPWRPPAVS